jgi:excisionase family DNA binding protein
MLSPLLTQREAASILAISVRTLERLRVNGGSPKFVKVGHSVRYRPEDLERWVAARLVSSTSQRPEAV